VKGVHVSRRKIINLTHSKAVTLPKPWITLMKFLGMDLPDELVAIASVNHQIVIYAHPEKAETALELIKNLEGE